MTCKCDMNGRGAACHCRACCLTFSSVSAFDHHIVYSQHCDPKERGMVQVRPDVWGRPPTAALAELRQQTGAV